MQPAISEYVIGLKGRLEAAPHGERSRLIDSAADRLRVSRNTVYRYLKSAGWASERKPRTDRGKTCVDTKLARQVAGLVVTATRANNKKTMPVTVAREVLLENGIGVVNRETGEVFMPSCTTLAKAMRLAGCHPEQLKRGAPAQELRSEYPNQCWQMDASVCIVFYLPSGKVAVMDEAKFYKNKPENLKKAMQERVIRWVITDHYSGALFVRYTQGAEDSAGILDVLIEAMVKRENEPFHGVPELLVTDKGAGNTSALIASFLGVLGVKHITHKPGNPRAKGQVEQAQNLVETQFEGRLRFLDVADLAALNTAVDAWRVYYNAKARHTRHGKARNNVWMTITEERLRVPASREVLQELAASPAKEVKVSDKMLVRFAIRGYGKKDYDVRYLRGIMPGQMVEVVVNPYRAPAIDVTVPQPDGGRETFTLEPVDRDAAGFRKDAPVVGKEYAALPDTAAETQLKTMHKEAYAAPTLEEADKAKAKGVRPYQDINALADVEAAKIPTYFIKRGRDLGLEQREVNTAPISHVDAAIALRPLVARKGLEWNADCLAWLKLRHPDSVPGDRLDELATELAAHFIKTPEQRRQEFRVVAVGGGVA